MGDARCIQCGSRATHENMNAEAPLCKEHDSEIKREHIDLRDKLNNISNQRKTMHLHMSPSASEATREHAKRRMEELEHEAENLRSRLADLQGRCSHANMKEDETNQWCPACGYSEKAEWSPEPAELRENEDTDVSAHAAKNIELIRQAERDGDIASYQADKAVDRLKKD